MKNQSFSCFLCTSLVIFFCFFISNLSATEFKRGDDLSGTDFVRYGKTGIYPKFLRFDQNMFLTPQEVPLYIKKHLKLPDAVTFEYLYTDTDKIGMTHTRYQQTVNGHPVIGGIIIAHARNGRTESVNGAIYPVPFTCPNAVTGEAAALRAALCTVPSDLFAFNKIMKDGSTYTSTPQPKLTFIPVDLDFDRADFRLAYKTDVYSLVPLSREWVYTDAETGEVIARESRICHADELGTANTHYSGTQEITTFATGNTYELRQEGKNILTINSNTGAVFTDSDNVWDAVLGTASEFAADCHYGAEVYHDLLTQLGRNSMDDAGHVLESHIINGDFFNNAFWNGEFATFGDGDGSIFTSFCHPEIVGHEFQHGTTEFSAGLIYDGESGAINESYSDILGKYTEIQAHGFENINWLIGSDVTVDGLGIRSMEDPNLHDNPDTYGGDFWSDFNGVHTNSGVQNHLFHILSQGEIGVNDLGHNYNVTGIGHEAAAEILLRSLVTYLTPASDYEDAAFYAVQSTFDLYGQCGQEYESMVNAWYAVGVGTTPIDVFGVSFNAEINTCELPATVQFINQSSLATDAFWDFGDGNTSTEFSPIHAYTAIGTFDVKLTVTSCDGQTDSLTMPDFVNIDPESPTCDTLVMQTSGIEVLTSCAGIILDPGGLENYPNDVNSYIVIAPVTSTDIILNFSQFSTEAGWDYLRIYEGDANTGTLIDIYDGVELDGQTITISGGLATLHFTSDGIITRPGFIIDYTTAGGTVEPIAGFAVENANSLPFNAPIQFIDESTNGGYYIYDFGDGTNTLESSPIHNFTQSGTFTVTQIVSNCVGSDTTSLDVTIQEPGTFSISPPDMCVSLLAGETLDTFAIITNGGSGDLYYGTQNPTAGGSQVSTIDYVETGVSDTEHNLLIGGIGITEINLTVTINGDFNNTGEEASVFVEGTFIEIIEDGNVANGTDIVSTYTFSDPTQIAAWLADGNLLVTVSNSSTVDPFQGGDDTHTVAVDFTGISFFTASPLTDIISPATSTNIDFNFQTEGLLGGDYFYDLIITTSDLAQPTVAYPVKMTVIGQPLIEVLPNSLDFGEQFTGFPAIDSLCIYNEGTDTLHITSVSVDDPNFEIEETMYSVPPLDSLKTAVIMPTNTAGSFSGTITLQSNAGTVTVGVMGLVNDPPISNITPAEICVTLEEGETSLQSIIIQNTGNSELIWNINETGPNGNPVELLAWTYGTDLNQEYLSTLDALDLGFPNYNLTETGTTEPAELAAALEDKRLLLLPKSEFGTSSVFSACAGVIQDFVAAGGGVIFLYDGAGDPYENTGFFNSFIEYSFFSDPVETFIDHPLTVGVDAEFNSPNAARGLSLATPEAVSIMGSTIFNDTYTLVAARDFGAGKAVYLGFDYANYTANTVILLANAVGYTATNPVPDWLTLEMDAGTVAANASQTVPVILDATGLLAGTYEYTVSLETNEPADNNSQVDVKLIVVAAPIADISIPEAVTCDGIVPFTDESQNDPTSWEWDFGDGETSTEQNPVHNYVESGIYDVTLTACNETGCNTQIFNNFITVNLDGDFCEELIFQTSGSTTLTSCTGTLYDDGGPDENYSNSVDYTVTIAPTNAATVTLEFVSFYLESCCDDFIVYDGPNTSSPILGNFTGNILPSNVTSTGPEITVRFDTDGSVTYTGFEVRYECTQLLPTAQFSSQIASDCENEVQFINNSQSGLEYEWNFGDGTTSNEFSPTHFFPETGDYTVVLTVSNQAGDDQAVDFITIDEVPFELSIVAPEIAEVNTPVSFSYESSTELTEIVWDLGPGGITTLPNPSYIFLQMGEQVITLTGIDAEGCSVKVTHTLTIDMNINTDDTRYITKFEIYPNPSTGVLQLYLELPQTTVIRYEVINLLGQKIAQVEHNNVNILDEQLDLQYLPKGTYLLQIYADREPVAQRKLILQ